MNQAEHRQAALTLREIARAFLLPPDWPVVITKPDGQVTIAAGELVRRIEKRYPSPSSPQGELTSLTSGTG